MDLPGADLVSFTIYITAEIADNPDNTAVPILTSVFTPFRANDTTTADWFAMYDANHQPVPLTLCCTRVDAERDDHDPNSTNMWKIVARNMSATGGPIYDTTVTFDIVTDHVIRIVATPAPKPIF